MVRKLGRRDFLSGVLGATALMIDPGCAPGAKKDEKTGYLYDDVYMKHLTGSGHPEKPERLKAVDGKIRESAWFDRLLTVVMREAGTDVVSLVHDREYIDKVKRECESGFTQLSTGDTPVCPESYSVALKAAGGVLSAVDAVIGGEAKNAFCAVRPPGHHATPDRGMGFCVFNNVAIAARYAQKKHNIERVLIADWDVHHGNGTQDTFYRDGSVFFMSTHQSPLYPGTGKIEETGEGEGKDFTMNRPFPEGAGNSDIIGAFRDDLLSAAREFKPGLTLISAGFDSRTGDPLGGFEIDDAGFRELTRIMIEIANINGEGRLVSVLEGGYSLEGLASAALAHLDELTRA